MSRARGFILPLTALHMHVFDFIEIIAQLFYTVSHFASCSAQLLIVA